MNLPLFIAGRYLFAKKSHNVINIISAISAIGMAIGTAALIIILSVYNGFDSIVKTMLGNVEPELLITPAEGKTFVPEGEVYDWLYAQQSVTSICTVLQENVFISYEGKQSIAKAKGVDSIYEEESPLKDYLRRGDFSLHHGDLPLAVTGAGLAHRLGIDPRFVAPIEMYFPSRTRNISLLNPAASIESVKVFPSGIFSVNNDIDNSLVILPIETMRELLGYDGNEVSAVEIRMTGASAKEIRKVQETAEKMLGSGFRVSDRFGQNPALYKMMKYEKASIYLILMFIIIIIAFNIFGSLSMLIMEKKDDMLTFMSMGASDNLMKRVFILEGWMISLAGLAAGIVTGIGFALIQQYFGIIRMPGNFIIEAYPVIISLQDILLTSVCIAAAGYLIARLPVALYYKKHHGHTAD